MKHFFTVAFAFVFSINFSSAQKCDSGYFKKAVDFYRNENGLAAINSLYQQIKACPFKDAYELLGFCHYATDSINKAMVDFSQAALLSDNAETYFHEQADWFFEKELYDIAFLLYQKVITKNPQSDNAYFKMGRCKWLERVKILVENKVEDYSTDTALVKHLKKEILYYYDKAIYLDSVKNYAKYLKTSANDAMTDMNTNYEYYYFRGLFKSNFYEYESSLKDYEMANRIHPTISGYKQVAYLARKVGQNKKACKNIQLWAAMYNPSEKISVLEKQKIAEQFCKELNIEIKR